MNDQDVRDFLERMALEEAVPFLGAELLARQARRRAAKTIVVAAVGITVIIAMLSAGVARMQMRSVPADDPPKPSVDLGIFAPLAGRIVYHGDSSLWGFDPNAPSPASTARVDLEGTTDAEQLASNTYLIGWSSDGTKLLFAREDASDDTYPYDRYLYVLHEDGTEIQLTPEPAGGASISPDGSRVVFADDESDGLYVVDANGGEPVRIADGEEPTFSPDGTQIAYLGLPRSGGSVAGGREHVWIANADGTDAHEILVDEPALDKGVFELQWSPAGDRLALGNTLNHHVGIYTFAPDGSAFTMVIPSFGRFSWSPDGSQIAFEGRGGVHVADVDGSDVQTVGEAVGLGPWHPATLQGPPDGGARSASPSPETSGTGVSEILWSYYTPNAETLVAVNPVSGRERVLVEDIPAFRQAAPSSDGRWVAYERFEGASPALYVIGSDLEPRKIGALPDVSHTPWAWSATGALLAVNGSMHVDLVDPATSSVSQIPSTLAIGSPPAWSPDGTTIVLGSATDGSIEFLDVDTGEASLRALLPDDDLAAVPFIAWSPDGSRLAVYAEVEPASGRLFLMDADGSNIRVLAEGSFFPGFDWSPDGMRITFAEQRDTGTRIWIAPVDGSMVSVVETAALRFAHLNNTWGLPVWSPDGTQVAFSGQPNHALVMDAEGSIEPHLIDDPTYASWQGGSFCYMCLWWINDPRTYSADQSTIRVSSSYQAGSE